MTSLSATFPLSPNIILPTATATSVAVSWSPPTTVALQKLIFKQPLKAPSCQQTRGAATCAGALEVNETHRLSRSWPTLSGPTLSDPTPSLETMLPPPKPAGASATEGVRT